MIVGAVLPDATRYSCFFLPFGHVYLAVTAGFSEGDCIESKMTPGPEETVTLIQIC